MGHSTFDAIISTLTSLVGFITAIGTLGSWISSAWAWYHNQSPTKLRILIAIAIIGTAVLAFLFGQQKAYQSLTGPIEIDLTRVSSSSNITITGVTFTAPNTIAVKGIYGSIDSDEEIWVYILSGDKKHHLKAARKNAGNTWNTVERVDIGDKDRFGGMYKVGIIIANPEECLHNTFLFDELPTCAQIAEQAVVKRH